MMRCLWLLVCLLPCVTPLAAADPGVLSQGGTVATREIHLRADGKGDYPAIQDAIRAAAPGSVILLADGVYQGFGNRDLDFGGKALTLRSESGQPAACVIDCQGSAGAGGPTGDGHRALLFASGEGPDAVVEGLTITGGNHSVGGAVWCHDGASPTFKNCEFVNNATSGSGGAVQCEKGKVLFEGCRFAGNRTEGSGGAISARDCAQVSLRNCVFTGNTAKGPGAAAHLAAVSVAEIRGCTFADNVGRALSAACQDLTITGSTFERNSAGAVQTSEGVTRMEDVVCRDNRALGGAAIAAMSATMDLRRVRFIGNQARDKGGALYFSCPSTLTVNDVLLTGNSAACGGAIFCERLTVHAAGPFTIASNTAAQTGGGIFVGHQGLLNLEGATLHANQSAHGSGIGFDEWDRSDLYLHNVIISAGVLGSAVWPSDTVVIKEVTHCNIWGNEGGDWTGPLAPFLGTADNITADPHIEGPLDQPSRLGSRDSKPEGN